MKKVLLALLLMFSISAYSQNTFDINQIPLKDGKITYTFIDTLNGSSKDEIHNKIVEWLAKNSKNSNHVIKLNDKESGRIIAKVSFQTAYRANNFNYTPHNELGIECTVKDGRYRIILTDFMIGYASPSDKSPSENIFLVIKNIESGKKDKAGERIMDMSIKSLDQIDNYARKLLQLMVSDIHSELLKKDDF